MRVEVEPGLRKVREEVGGHIEKHKGDDGQPQHGGVPQRGEVSRVRQRHRDEHGVGPDQQRPGNRLPTEEAFERFLQEVRDEDVVGDAGKQTVCHNAEINNVSRALAEGGTEHTAIARATKLLAEECDHHEAAALHDTSEHHHAQARQHGAAQQGRGQAEDACADQILREIHGGCRDRSLLFFLLDTGGYLQHRHLRRLALARMGAHTQARWGARIRIPNR
mmetsp:Transcript_64803/g.163187  ORF Transcript_64803/g.163187 Transcript_64803/m.163187 type:complete len:221 (-) Transcript_64803:11-673(-)